MRDLELLAAHFLQRQLPKNKEYLRKYFKGPTLRYCIYFITFPYDGHFKRYYSNMVAHTGIYFNEAMAYNILDRFVKLEERLAYAEQNHNPELVAAIKMGQWSKGKERKLRSELNDKKTAHDKHKPKSLPAIKANAKE